MLNRKVIKKYNKLVCSWLLIGYFVFFSSELIFSSSDSDSSVALFPSGLTSGVSSVLTISSSSNLRLIEYAANKHEKRQIAQNPLDLTSANCVANKGNAAPRIAGN